MAGLRVMKLDAVDVDTTTTMGAMVFSNPVVTSVQASAATA